MKLTVEPSECLLSEPGSLIPGEKLDRQSMPIKMDEKLDGRNIPRQFSRQYCHSYTSRLWAVRPKLEKAATSEWPGVELKRVAELCEFSQAKTSSGMGSGAGSSNGKVDRKSGDQDHGQHISFKHGVTVAIIGTVFKCQPEKPSILQELAEENLMEPVVPRTNYTSDKDTIQLEDETTRVHLVPTPGCGMTIGSLVNGIICGVKGRPTINGKFEVTEVIFPTPIQRPILDIKMNIEMVFVSGMEFGSGKDSSLQTGLFFDYLEGLSGCPSEVESSIQKKTTVFFVGDTFGIPLGKNQPILASVAANIDEKLEQISQTMDVLMLPSENDPSKPMLPQAPIHRCVLPRASRRPTFKALSNPARLEIPISNNKDSVGLDIILSSGSNVTDAMRNSDVSTPLEMAQNLLRWGHLCPTAPDTLPLHPGVVDDVFVVDILPHVFVVGNQESFDATEWMNTKIFTLPKFSETGTAVLLTSDLDLIPLNFKVF